MLLFALLIGWWLDALGWALAAALAGLLAWHNYQLSRLYRWLLRSDGSDAPEAPGAWGHLTDAIYRLQRQHRQSEAHLRGVIKRVQESSSALKDAVVMIDSQGNMEWWNRAAKQLLGLRRPDDVGQGVLNLIRDPRFVRYFERRDYDTPLELPSPVNPAVRLQYTIAVFGKHERLMLVRDVTRLYRLERMRQDFVGNASHELRTPLTVIQGYLETLQDQLEDREPGLRRALQQMEGQARRMRNLVTDMLMLSRLETTESLSDELPIDLGHLLRELRENALALAQDKSHQITLEVDERYLLMGQEAELLSAFSNLVYNAVKYTPEGGDIDVRWWVDGAGGHFSVRDDGIGIEPHHISRLTERFYRVDAGRSSAAGGTGLGLAIVKHVMLRHGARLEIDSRPGEGSLFLCHFPAHLLRPASAMVNEDSA
nr:phosphate regulon sensor histidine kinase PhoR [Motiliproteus sp. SC1-56]